MQGELELAFFGRCGHRILHLVERHHLTHLYSWAGQPPRTGHPINR